MWWVNRRWEECKVTFREGKLKPFSLFGKEAGGISLLSHPHPVIIFKPLSVKLASMFVVDYSVYLYLPELWWRGSWKALLSMILTPEARASRMLHSPPTYTQPSRVVQRLTWENAFYFFGFSLGLWSETDFKSHEQKLVLKQIINI